MEVFMTHQILIIDDDDGFRETIKIFLETEGFTPAEAKNGEEANKYISENQVAFVIIDALLPRKNGFKVLEEIKAAKGNQLPILMISGFYKGYKHKQDAVNLGALDYLEKPFDFEKDLKPILIKTFQKKYPVKKTDDDDIFEDSIDVNKIDTSSFLGDKTQTVQMDDLEVEDLPDFNSLNKNDIDKANDDLLKESPTNYINGIIDVIGGDLEDTLPYLLIDLYKKKITGELYIDNEDETKKIVYIEEGMPIYIKSTLINECLGNILVAEKIITPVERDKSLDIMKKTRKPQGKVLRELNVISLENLKYGLLKQLEVKLFDIFTWKSAKYKFKPIKSKLPIPPRIYDFEYSFAYLIYNGVMNGYTIDDLKVFFKQYAKSTVIFNTSPDLEFWEGELFDDETDFLNSLKQTRTIFDIVKEHASDKENVLKQLIIYNLLGLITFK